MPADQLVIDALHSDRTFLYDVACALDLLAFVFTFDRKQVEVEQAAVYWALVRRNKEYGGLPKGVMETSVATRV